MSRVPDDHLGPSTSALHKDPGWSCNHRAENSPLTLHTLIGQGERTGRGLYGTGTGDRDTPGMLLVRQTGLGQKGKRVVMDECWL